MAVGALVIVAVFGAALGAIAPGAGSDAISIFQFEPSELEAAQGETVTVEMKLFAGGVSHDIGVDRVEIEAHYDDEALTLQDVERGEWMERGEETDVEMSVDESDGAVTIRQVRDPAAGGVTGTDIFARLTFEVDTDAEPGEYTLSYGDGEVQMVNDHYQPVFTHDATLTVAGGDTQTEDASRDAASSGESNENEESDENGDVDQSDGADGETLPGFGFLVAGLGVLTLAGVVLVRRLLI